MKRIAVLTNGSDPLTEGSIPVYGSGESCFKTCGEFKEGPTVLLGRKGATLHIPHYIEGRYWNVDTAFDVKMVGGNSLRWFYYLAFCFDYKAHMSQTTLPGMTQTAYANMKIPLPTIEIQRKIADYLDSQCSEIDAAIKDARATVEDCKIYKMSLISEVVTGKLRVEGKSRNDGVLAVGAGRGSTAGTPSLRSSGVDWLGDIPAAWDVVPVKYLLTEVNSRSESGTEEPLSMSQVLGIVPSSMINVANPAASFIGAKKVSPGDLVFNKLKAHLGVFAVSSYEGLVSPDYAVYRSTSLSDVGYLSYLFHSTNCIDEFRRHVRGVGQGLSRLYSSDLFAIKVPLPPLEEQRRIASLLDEKCGEIDAVIADKERLIADLETYKKSLIFEVVTGKLEVA